MSPRSICSAPSCKQIAVENGRCNRHLQKPKASSKKQSCRSSTTVNEHIYQSTKWRKLRARKAKESPLCENCLTYNIIKPVDVVDHIKPLLDYPDLAYVFSNLQSLCHQCHNDKTAKETAERKKPKQLTASELFNQIRKK
ncbi:HNH endonuclease [Vibrio parahaemolyticus]|uniref:HNH endonuclease n=1 Tax=Vibrio alginolyticus TaxID=663 RepID=UPI00215C66A2|nr:HNH endonuclease [Vibrio alginolyticus]EKA7406927.1 HNH endonuclease [Vibrio parahaemolyticus]ELA9275640.1 HNH endonuclease [Vibrio parahaemolyticus]ELA9334990.1 HNH endonuclease [Vibrio parahaemolyticus]MCR9961743.1 HNH endonuclease [Vibrio alginolyticus]MCS0300117.1 HNH endonuclease [Vibrio alginolyticus]